MLGMELTRSTCLVVWHSRITYKQQVAAVPYNERKITLCTLYHDGRKESLSKRREREKSTKLAYLA